MSAFDLRVASPVRPVGSDQRHSGPTTPISRNRLTAASSGGSIKSGAVVTRSPSRDGINDRRTLDGKRPKPP
jgi:hypothetical protein